MLLKNTGDKNRFTYLARQVYPEDSAGLYEAYLEATKQLHGYLVLDFAQDTDDLLRFRTRIFPGEGPPAFYTPYDDEADKGSLSRAASTEKSQA